VNAGTAIRSVDGQTALTAVDVRARINLIQEVMSSCMKKDVHYGVIPGTPKPTLYKAGAEKLIVTFRLAVGSPVVEDLSTPDEAHYRIQVPLTAQDGSPVAVGIGEASSDEDKYRWRKPVCPQEWDEAAEDRRREVWKNYKNGPTKIKQVRMRPCDVSNTILKMAHKRAFVQAAIMGTAASDVFDQDVEDLPEGYEVSNQEDARPAIPMPQAKPKPVPSPAPAPAPTQAPAPVQNPEPAAGGLTVVEAKAGKSGTTKNGKPYTIYNITLSDGVQYASFSESVFAAAGEAKEIGAAVVPDVEQTKYGPQIKSLAIIEPSEVPDASS
jgi:hypothetical protein